MYRPADYAQYGVATLYADPVRHREGLEPVYAAAPALTVQTPAAAVAGLHDELAAENAALRRSLEYFVRLEITQAEHDHNEHRDEVERAAGLVGLAL